MGEVGGNGSVVWKNTHRGGGTGEFQFKPGTDKLGPRDLRKRGGDIEGRDDSVAVNDIGRSQAPDTAEYKELANFQRLGSFFVRLRFDGAEADAVRTWFETSRNNVPAALFTIYQEGASLILAVNVKAIYRDWPNNGVSWSNLPWEIRYDW